MANIDKVLAKLQKELGASIAEQPSGKTVSSISTGSLALDIALGVGGWPIGYFTELYGKKGGGKTTLCMSSCIRVAANGGRAIYFDLEHKVLPEYFHGCGLPKKQLIWLRTDTESQATRVLDMLHENVEGPLVILARLYSGTLTLDVLRYVLMNQMAQLAILDSIAGITSTIEFGKKAQDVTVALTARIMSASLRSLAAPLGLSNCAVVLVNQVREQISSSPYPMPRTTPGGWAIKFWSAIRAEIARTSASKTQQTSIVRVRESCLSAPKTEAEIDIIYGRGVDYVKDVFNAAVASKVVSVAGGWCKFDGESLGEERTKEKATEYLRSNPKLVEKIRNTVLSHGTRQTPQEKSK